MTACALYGAFIFPAIIAVYLLLKKGVQGYRRKILIACVIILILLNTWNYVLASAIVPLLVQDDILSPGNEIVNFVVQISWPGTICLMISDGIVVWRACVIWPDSKIIKYMLTTLMLGNIAINLADCIFDNLTVNFFGNLISLDVSVVFISLGVNFAATFLIGLKVWHHHCFTKELYSLHKQNVSPTTRILLMLVESGGLFCIAQIVIAILTVLDTYTSVLSSLDLAFAVANQFYIGITPIYPLAVLIMLSMNHSPLEDSFHTTHIDWAKV